uniref:IgGFc-binding protein-like n=1 Tax=Ciona intestinalis TaxID=7719 RepID=UPI00089DB92B|nr:IgGFc-binding protein-like [Ciona intestinalis]|eukprot:XP_009860325.2 IgGFc-binding protein-like [Ciona intestinalis]
MAAFQILFCFLLLGFLHASGQTTCAVQPPSTTTFKAVLLENLVNVTRAHFVKNSVGADGFSKVNADQKYELFDLFAARYDNSASTQAFLAGFLDILYSTPTPTTTESHLSKVVELIKIGDVDSARVETRNAIAAGMRSNHMLNATNKDRLTMAEAHALAMLLDTIFNTIRSELSTRNFEVYLSLKVGSTLAFAIDTTGSMSGEINAAKSRVSAIINETTGTTDQPLFFVLSEFNDPRVGPTLATTSPTAILTGLNALRASGGGDEPELALAGIYNALIASTKRSVVFMITDATAKDVNLETRVIAQSVIRKIRIVSLLTKNLPSAAGFPLYNRISSSSGGLVTVTSKSDITGTSQLFRALTEQGQVKLKIALNVTAQNSSFVMDSTITRVTILLTRTSLTGNLNVASITNPAGSVGFKELVNNDGLVLIQLNSTVPGKYFINLVEEISFSLEVSGSSVFGGLPTVFEVENVTGAFVHNNQARAGNEAHIVVDMFGDLRGTQLEDICLMTPDFTLIQAIPVARCGNGLEEYRTIPTFTIPTQPFLILLLGKNNVTGEKFHRVDPCIITPLVANYQIDPIPDQVIDSGSVITVSTKFTNNDLADTFTFDVSDSRQYVQSWTPGSGVTTSIAKSVNRNVRITISVPSTAENDVISKVTVIATAQNGKEFVFTTFNVIVRNVKVVKCPTLIAPSGGSLSCSKFNAEGSICQVVCEPDYVIDGAQQTNCTNGSWTFNNLKCRFVGKKQCKVSGDPHYTTFDGKRYDFQGTCIYQTVKTTFNSTRGRLEPFSILVENELRSKSFRKVSWFRRAFIDIKGTLIVFRKRRKISVDGILVNVPIQIEVDSANIVNINQRGSLVVLTTSFGLTITYDGNARFIITLSGSYANLVTGLCGNINGNENDDLRLASNHSILANPNKFGNSYKVGGWSAGCQDGDPNDADGNCIEANNYRNLCNVVDGSCFTECRAGIKTPDIVQDCVFDMCVTSGDLQALEEAVADYADSCQENGFKICDWRKITKTPKNCQPNAHYEHEGTACPNSCIFPNRAKRCSRPKISGCVCDSGYVLSGQDCVRLSQCGCTSAGRYYKDGDTFLNTDCTERCTCRNTKLTCKATSCVAGAEKCGISPTTLEKTCMPITTATCRATGDPHYRSFDNKKFDFQGSCTYTMVKTVSMPPTRSFAIRTQHEFRPPNKIGTYVKFVYIEFSTASANLTITLGKFNGESSVSAKVENYFMTTQYIRDYKDSLFTVKVQGKGPVVIFCGVEVKYNGHTAKITLPGVYSNKVTGLCGNFNGNENDDTTTANGTFTTDLNEFGVSFQHGTCGTPKPPPPLVCSVADIAKWNSTKFCGVLTSATSIFAACQAKLDLTTLQDDCVFDMCANNGGLSLLHEILALAVEECTPITGPMCNWRANLNVTIPPCPAKLYLPRMYISMSQYM